MVDNKMAYFLAVLFIVSFVIIVFFLINQKVASNELKRPNDLNEKSHHVESIDIDLFTSDIWWNDEQQIELSFYKDGTGRGAKSILHTYSFKYSFYQDTLLIVHDDNGVEEKWSLKELSKETLALDDGVTTLVLKH